MKHGIEHTLINIMSFVGMVILVMLFYGWITSVDSGMPMSDHGLGEIASAAGEIILTLLVAIILFIMWTIRMIFSIRKLKAERVYRIVNLLILLIAWSPIAYALISTGSESLLNKYQRNQYVLDVDDYQLIPFPDNKRVASQIFMNDSLVFALQAKSYGGISSSSQTDTFTYLLLSNNRLIQFDTSHFSKYIIPETYIDTSTYTKYFSGHFKDTTTCPDNYIALFQNTTLGKNKIGLYHKAYLRDVRNNTLLDSILGFSNITHSLTYTSRGSTNTPIESYFIADGTLYFLFYTYPGWGS